MYLMSEHQVSTNISNFQGIFFLIITLICMYIWILYNCKINVIARNKKNDQVVIVNSNK